MRKLTLIPAALLLAGCSTPAATVEGPPEDLGPTESPVFSTEQPFQFYAEGAEGVIQFGAEPLPGFLEYQEAVGNTDAFSFATVDVDNRNGSESVDSIGALAYTPEGVQHECQHVNNVLTDHIPEEPTTPEQIDLYYALDGSYGVSVGQRETVHLVCAGKTPEQVASASFRTMGMEHPAMPVEGEQ